MKKIEVGIGDIDLELPAMNLELCSKRSDLPWPNSCARWRNLAQDGAMTLPGDAPERPTKLNDRSLLPFVTR
jgi:hypothetical protein